MTTERSARTISDMQVFSVVDWDRIPGGAIVLPAEELVGRPGAVLGGHNLGVGPSSSSTRTSAPLPRRWRRTVPDKVMLAVNGEEIELNAFVRKALIGVVEGFVNALHSVPEPRERIEVTIVSARNARTASRSVGR